MNLLEIDKKTRKQYGSAPQPVCRSKIVYRKIALSVSQDNANLTLTGITEITYVAVFLFTFCKQTHKKEFSFLQGTIIIKY